MGIVIAVLVAIGALLASFGAIFVPLVLVT